MLQITELCLWLIILAAIFLAAIFTPLERLFALHPKEIFRDTGSAVSAVPEPSSVALRMTGFASLGDYIRSRVKKS